MYYIMLYVCHGHAASCVFLLVTKTFLRNSEFLSEFCFADLQELHLMEMDEADKVQPLSPKKRTEICYYYHLVICYIAIGNGHL
jgi:hypothetical protein